MAVACYREENGYGEVISVITRNFHPPARACELKYWWKAVQKAIPSMAAWQPSFANGAFIDIDVIMLEGRIDCENPIFLSLTINRKKWLK